MLRQIQVKGQVFELRSLDGRLWASSPKYLIQFKRRREAFYRAIKLTPEARQRVMNLQIGDESQ